VKTEIGEYIVGAYLKEIIGCDFVDYNVRPPGGGLEGLGELDVVGLQFGGTTAYLCEVTTHIRGFLYKDNKTSVERIAKKHRRQREYARKHLSDFESIRYMFWSPVVPVGYLTENLAKIEGLELIINGRYKTCVDELREKARTATHDTGNVFFRTLQILERLRAD